MSNISEEEKKAIEDLKELLEFYKNVRFPNEHEIETIDLLIDIIKLKEERKIDD